MRFDQPLEPATLIGRYKRFLADVRLHGSGEETTVHCPNPGAMLGLDAPGSLVWLHRSFSPTRKLPLTLEIVEADGGLVGVDTMLPNKLVAEALAADAIPELTGYASHRREVKYGEASRIDFLLEGEGRPACWLEVKNCHLMRTPGLAEFPDCKAARSAKHLRELIAMKRAGDRAVVLFTVQRMDCERFATADDIDPVFGQGLRDAIDAGVELIVCGVDVTAEAITLWGAAWNTGGPEKILLRQEDIMSDDKTKEDYRDREKVSASEGYEVRYFAEKHGISRERTLELIKAHDGDRAKMEAALND